MYLLPYIIRRAEPAMIAAMLRGGVSGKKSTPPRMSTNEAAYKSPKRMR